MAKIIGIDIGYGFTKSYYSQGELNGSDMCCFSLFPTAISSYIPRVTFSENEALLKINGEAFIAGEYALREGIGLINTRQSNFVGSNAYCAILGMAILKTANDPDILVMGLPPGLYNKEFVSEIVDKIRSSRISSTDGTVIKIPDEIRFIPQGSGIFFSHVKNGNKDVFNKRVVIVDVGYYTLDVMFFVKGKYVENSARSHQLGIARLHEQVKKEFENEFRITLKNHDSIDTLLKSGVVKIMDKPYVLDTRCILDSYVNEVSSTLSNYIENLSDEVDLVVGGGGGVNFIKDTKSKYGINITNQPQFANARGYFEYGKHALRKIKQNEVTK